MSRCFPFPPPGYEKKSRPDDANLLIKEKSKEKRHKKEKKDKEKKEKKEKRDKGRSEEKRREKKEKKHKHEDKKDKERDKEKKRTSENKKVSVTSVHQNGGKPSPTGILGIDFQPQLLLELEKRLRNDDGATESRRVEKIIAPDQDSVCLQGKFTEIKEKPKDKREDHRMVNGQTFKVVAKGLENGVASSFMGEDRKKVEGGICAVEKVDEKRKERKEKKKHRNSDGKGDKHQDRDQKKQNKSKDKRVEKGKEKEERSKLQIKQSSIDTADNGSSYLFGESSWSNGILGKRKDPETNGVLHDNDSWSYKLSRPLSSSRQLIQNGSKYDPSQDHKGNAEVPFHKSVLGNGRKLDLGHIVHSFVSEQKSRVNNLKVPNSLLVTQAVEGAGRELESCQAARNFTHLEPGVVVGNHMVNNKVSSSQPVVEKQGRSNCSQPNIHTSVESQGPFCPSKMGNKKHVINGLIKTQESTNIIEEVETHKSPLRLNSEYPSQILNVDNKVSALQPVVESWGRSDCSQPNIHKAVESQGLLCPPKVDNKKNVINGLIKTQPPKKVKEVEAQKRPPHPDSKYLNQILSVPEVEWPDYDDQEWLFSSGASKAKKPRTVSSEIDETKQVWAEALQIESADIVALPYVIPY